MVAKFRSQNYEIFNQGGVDYFDLKFTNVSSGCCRFLKMKAEKMVGGSVEMVVPEVYRGKHREGVRKMVKVNKEEKIGESGFLGKIVETPFLKGDGSLTKVMMRMVVSSDSKNELRFVVVLDKPFPETELVFLDKDGEPMGKSKNRSKNKSEN